MNTNRRSGIVGGVILILLGIAFLVAQSLPGLRSWLSAEDSWPLIIIGVGVVLFVLALNTPPLAVPGCIVGGIGCILFYQNATGNWASWSYAWALIPGFVGLGGLISGLLEGRARSVLVSNFWMILISLVAFVFFGSFLGLGRLTPYWPILLVLGGLLILGQGIFRRRP